VLMLADTLVEKDAIIVWKLGLWPRQNAGNATDTVSVFRLRGGTFIIRLRFLSGGVWLGVLGYAGWSVGSEHCNFQHISSKCQFHFRSVFGFRILNAKRKNTRKSVRASVRTFEASVGEISLAIAVSVG